MTHDLTNRTALVTGAARGIGLAISGALATRGAQVALLDVIEADPSGLPNPAGSIAIVADITRRADVE